MDFDRFHSIKYCCINIFVSNYYNRIHSHFFDLYCLYIERNYFNYAHESIFLYKKNVTFVHVFDDEEKIHS